MLEHVQRNHDTVPEHGLHLYEKFADPPETVLYREFPARIAAYAEHFRAHGIGPGTRVIVPFETSAAVILSFLALMEAGALPLSVKPLLPHSPKAGYEDFLGRVAGSSARRRCCRRRALPRWTCRWPGCRCPTRSCGCPARGCACRPTTSWPSCSSPRARPRSRRASRSRRGGCGPTWR
ncbi:AMP-binding protein [Catellatospora bangladeshensis]|uniref:AMP-binding protein n=1 Tax=Catellatospora bangladeshensis TaxID=310355 RepID=UPI00361C7310